MAFADRLPGWVRHHIPTRESVQRNWLLRPFAKQLSDPALWRLGRRSVPRGVAVGLGVGVIIPFMHTFIAALLAIPARANVAVAAAVTLLINPLTIPPLYYAAYQVGRWELHHDRVVVDPLAARQFTSELARILFWIHHASGPIALGIVNIAIATAAIGYTLSAFLWRLWLASKWRQRRESRRAAKA